MCIIYIVYNMLTQFIASKKYTRIRKKFVFLMVGSRAIGMKIEMMPEILEKY